MGYCGNTIFVKVKKGDILAVKEWEWLKDNPVSRVQKERENNEVDRWLTEYEERRLLGNRPDWLREKP